MALFLSPCSVPNLEFEQKPVYAKHSRMARRHRRYQNDPVISVVVPFHPRRGDFAILSTTFGVDKSRCMLLMCTIPCMHLPFTRRSEIVGAPKRCKTVELKADECRGENRQDLLVSRRKSG